MKRHPTPPLAEIYADVANYYGAKVRRHGPTPLGVDWTNVPTQELRFVQLLKLVGRRRNFSINDVGCGYGALLEFLRKRFPHAAIRYAGVDLAPEMIASAMALHGSAADAGFSVGHQPAAPADYCVASGIFNVKLYRSDAHWHDYVARTLGDMARASRKGFAANFLAPVADGEGRQELYRVQPQVWLDYCKTELGCEAETAEGYGLAEFTLRAVIR